MKAKYKTKRIEYLLILLFVIAIVASVVFGLVLKMYEVSFALLAIDFPLAVIIAIFASLGLREEEEAKNL